MRPRKPNPARSKPDLTVEVDVPLCVFMDKPRGKLRTTSEGVVTSYDPAVAALAERRQLALILENCLRTASSIKSKRGTQLVTLLRDARRRVELLDHK